MSNPSAYRIYADDTGSLIEVLYDFSLVDARERTFILANQENRPMRLEGGALAGTFDVSRPAVVMTGAIRIWRCPECGVAWTRPVTWHYRNIDEGCPGMPVLGVFAPLADCREGWQVDNGYGLVVIDKEPLAPHDKVLVVDAPEEPAGE